MNKQQNPNQTKIRLTIPKEFLAQFDKDIQTTHISRNEAIRHAMKLFLQNQNQQHPTQKQQPFSRQTGEP